MTNPILRNIGDFIAGSGIRLTKYRQQMTIALGDDAYSNPLLPWIDVRAFGAVGDGVTDDTAAIQATFDYAATFSENTSPKVYFPACAGFKVTSGVVCQDYIDVYMDGPIIKGLAGDYITLTVGKSGHLNARRNLRLWVWNGVAPSWSSESNIGIQLIDTLSGRVEIVDVMGFTIGVQLYAHADILYNIFTLGSIYGCKYGMDIMSDSAYGAVNDNIFIGGEFSSTGAIAGQSRYGIRFSPVYYHNSNIFHKQGFELDASGASPGEAVPILINSGARNKFYNPRFEGNSSTVMRVNDASGNSSNNSIEDQFGDSTCVVEHIGTYFQTYGNAPNYISPSGNQFLSKWGQNLIYDSGPLLSKVSLYRWWGAYTFGDQFIVGLSIWRGLSDGSVDLRPYLSGGGYDPKAIGNGFVSLYHVGFFVDTSLAKEFILNGEVDPNTTYHFSVACFDSNGVILTSADPHHPYVFGNGAYYYSGTPEFSYLAYSSGHFKVHTDVKKIFVYFYLCNLASFRLYNLDHQITKIWSGTENKTGNLWAVESPQKGSYEQGWRILNDTPSAGGVEGWVCITAGTLATALSGVTGNITINTKILTVNDATNLYVGSYITIVGVTGVKKITAISGTTVTIDSNADATVTGAAVAWSAAVFKTFGTIGS